MLRIWQTEEGPSTVSVRLEGRLGGPWVAELERLCEALFVEGKYVTLDLCDVAFIDQTGIRLIRKFSSRGAKVTNSSPFVANLLHQPDEKRGRES